MTLKLDSSQNVNTTGIEKFFGNSLLNEREAHQEFMFRCFTTTSESGFNLNSDGHNFLFLEQQNFSSEVGTTSEAAFLILSKNYEPVFRTNEHGIQSLDYSLVIEALAAFFPKSDENKFSLYMPTQFYFEHISGASFYEPKKIPLNSFLYISNVEPITEFDTLGFATNADGYVAKVTLKVFDTLPELQNLKVRTYIIPEEYKFIHWTHIEDITFGFKSSSLISSINISEHKYDNFYKPWDDLGKVNLNKKELVPVIVNTIKNNENYDSYYFWSLDANNNANLNEILHNTKPSDQSFQLKNFLCPSDFAGEVERTIFKLLENTRLFQSGFVGFTDEEKATWFLNNGNITNLQDLNDWIVRKMLSKLELFNEWTLYIKFRQVILMLSSHIKSSYAFKGGLTDEHKAAQYAYLIAFYENNVFKLYTASSLLWLSTKRTRSKPLSKRNREIIEMLGKEINPDYVFEETEWTSEKLDFESSNAESAFFDNGTFHLLNSSISFPINNWNDETQNISQNPLDFNNLSRTFNYVYFLPLEPKKIKNLTGKLVEKRTIENPTEVKTLSIIKKDKTQPTPEEVKKLLPSGYVAINEEELKKYAFLTEEWELDDDHYYPVRKHIGWKYTFLVTVKKPPKQFGIWRMNVIPNFKNAKEFEKYLLENEVVEQPNSMNRMIFKPNKSFRDVRKIEIKGLWLDGYINISGVSQTFPRYFRFDLPAEPKGHTKIYLWF